MELWLVRHTAPRLAPGICYGRSDVAVDPDEVAAAAARLRAALPAGLPVYSSPLSRCRRLAEALDAAPRYDERLIELDFGAWELQSWDRLERALLDAWAADPLGFAPPGGESPAQLHARAGAFLADLAGRGETRAVIVSHGGPLRALAGHLHQLPPAEWMVLEFPFGTAVRIAAGGPAHIVQA